MSKPQILPPAHLAEPRVPKPSVPSLPASSGAVWGSARSIMRKDTEYVRQHTEFLQARAAQATAMRVVIDARHDLALAIARLASLPELAVHEYERGRRDRAHELATQALEHQISELSRAIELARVRKQFEDLNPPPAKPDPAPGLTPDEVEELLSVLPEINPDTVTTIRRLLAGRLKEKTA